MNLNIKVLGGKDISVKVQDDASVISLKRRIQQEYNIPLDQQKILIKGKSLSDKKMLSDYEISETTKLNLVLKKVALTQQQQQQADTKTTRSKYHIEDFWKTLVYLLSKKYTGEEVVKIMNQYQKDYQMLIKTMSLDDIERIAKRELKM